MSSRRYMMKIVSAKKDFPMFGHNPRKHPSLPQNDSPKEQQKRQDQLEDSRGEYIWDMNFENVVGVPMSEKVPRDDKPTLSWLFDLAEVALEVAENAIEGFLENLDDDKKKEFEAIKKTLGRLKDAHHERKGKEHHSWLVETLEAELAVVSGDMSSVLETLQSLSDMLTEHAVNTELASQQGLEPYKALFNSIKLADVAEQFQENSMFAYYRVGGPNPMLLKLITALPDNFPVSDEGFRSVMGDSDALAGALGEKRVFMLDYAPLQPITEDTGVYKGQKKQLFAPLVMLARPRDADDLVPVAIQRFQDPDAYPIVYAIEDCSSPDYWPWQTAMSIVENAEGNYHELFVHLARTHLVIEAFAVATRRNLAEEHPLYTLLLPHFEGTLFINDKAATSLISPDGPIDQIFAGKIAAAQVAAGKDRLAFDFYGNMLKTELAARGVDDPDVLPNFPYRDDAILVWQAISDWVNNYVNIYYKSEQDVTGDTELTSWTSDLINEGKIKGFRAIESRAQLVEVLTMIIFTASAQHAAVNFPQRPFMTYSPAIAGAIWGPENPAGENEAAWLKTLLPIDLAKQLLNLLYVLGSVYYIPLGEYRTNNFPYLDWFADDAVTKRGGPLDQFQDALSKVDEAIEARNSERKIPYEFLSPKKIPMSINI